MMFANIFAIIMMVAAMLGGGGAAAVYAAQDSLPGEALYTLKTWSEEVRMDLSSSEETRLQLNLEYAERRMAELAEVADEDNDLAAQTMLRLQTALNQALEECSRVEAGQAQQARQRVRSTLMSQQRLMEQIQLNANPLHEPQMTQTRERLTEQLRVVEDQLQGEPPQPLGGGALQNGQQKQPQNQQGRPSGPGEILQPGAGQGQAQGSSPQQGQGSPPDAGQTMNQNRFRITLTPGATPAAEQLQQGKGNGFVQTPQP